MEASTTGQGNGVIWRIGSLETRVSKIEDLKPEVMAYEIGELAKDMRAVKRLLMTLIVTIACSAVSFALTVLAATGRI